MNVVSGMKSSKRSYERKKLKHSVRLRDSWLKRHKRIIGTVTITLIGGFIVGIVLDQIFSGPRERTMHQEIYREFGQIRTEIGEFQDYVDGLPGTSDIRKKKLFERGMVARDSSKYDEARDLFRGILSLNPSPAEKVAVLILVGNAFVAQSRLEEAQGSYSEAIELARQHDISDGEAAALGNIGLICVDKGELDEAVEFLAGALGVFRSVGSKVDVDKAQRIIEEIHRETGSSSKKS